MIATLKKEIFKSIENKVKGKKNIGLLFSGGVDSTTIAFILKELEIEFTCYTSALKDEGLEDSKDLIESQKVAKEYSLNHKIITLNLEETESKIKEVIETIGSTNVVKVGVGLPFFIAFEQAEKDGVEVMLSGLGSEEIFAGYDRHKKADDINAECKRGLVEMHHRDLVRDYAIAKHFEIELKMPFLEPELVKFALDIPGEYKIKGEENKLILRETAIEIGVKEEFAMRKKMGAQYGSKFDRALSKIAKKNGFKKKSEYLDSLKE